VRVPLVSLVMPTLNSAEHIGETLCSLADQTYSRFELIVVDGGSTDQTLSIARRFSGPAFQIIELEPGRGIAAALNTGMAAARGDFIGRMDADDVAYKWRIHDQVHHLFKHPDVGLVGTGVDAFGDHEAVYRGPLSHKSVRDEFLVNNPFFHPTVMFRRELWDTGLYRYDEDHFFEEDYELWARLIPRVQCVNMDQSSIRYRISANSTQWDPRKYRYKRDAIAGFCGTFGLDDEELIDALAEFQCASFIRHGPYEVMRRYAVTAGELEIPRLGWLHEALLREPDYVAFTRWFRGAKGWPV
jgi:glycosyltransferase involved in cell wall biosynthesis